MLNHENSFTGGGGNFKEFWQSQRNTMGIVSFPIMGVGMVRKPEKEKSCLGRIAGQGLSAEKQKRVRKGKCKSYNGNSWSKKKGDIYKCCDFNRLNIYLRISQNRVKEKLTGQSGSLYIFFLLSS